MIRRDSFYDKQNKLQLLEETLITGEKAESYRSSSFVVRRSLSLFFANDYIVLRRVRVRVCIRVLLSLSVQRTEEYEESDGRRE
jgi:hypothetical protein